MCLSPSRGEYKTSGYKDLLFLYLCLVLFVFVLIGRQGSIELLIEAIQSPADHRKTADCDSPALCFFPLFFFIWPLFTLF